MDELSQLRELQPPRQSPLVAGLAARFAPLWGFAVYGLLYTFVAFAIGIAAVFAVASVLNSSLHLAPGQPLPPWTQPIVTGTGLATFVLSFTPIVLWARVRRSQLRRLVRDGHWVSAQISRVDVIVMRTTRVTRAVLAFQDGNRTRKVAVSVPGEPPELATGAAVPVLVEPSCRYVAAFISGRALPAR
jgi:hypothetical protein